MLGSVARSAMRAANRASLKRTMATASSDLLPPLRVAVTGAAGQIGYAMLMRIARYVSNKAPCADGSITL